MFVGHYMIPTEQHLYLSILSWFIQLINNVIPYLMLTKHGCISFQTELFERSKDKNETAFTAYEWLMF